MEAIVDAAVVKAAQAGDPQAVDEVVAAALPLVYNVVARALSGSSDVDDVVQETMLRVVRHLGALKEPDRFRAWLVTTAIRQIRSHLRARRPLLPLEVLEEQADVGPDLAENTVNRMAQVEEGRDVLAATRWLSYEDRALFGLWWQEVNGTLTRADVAAAISLSTQHTAVRVQRMKEQLITARTVLRAWRADPRCADLAVAGKGWHGHPEPRWFKRLARHVRGCPRCRAVGAPHFPAEYFAVQIGVLAVPAALQGTSGLLSTGTGAVTAAKSLVDYATVKPLMAMVPVAGIASVVALVAMLVPTPDDEPEPIALPTISTASAVVTPTVTASPTAASSSPPPTVPTALYVAPNGQDTAAGTEDAPFGTLAQALSIVQPGQTIYLRGGIHRTPGPLEITTSGTADRPITLAGYPAERAILDASLGSPDRPYITHRAAHWAVRGFDLMRAPGLAVLCESCRNTVFQGLSIHDNGGTGLLLRGPDTVDNQVLDSDFHHNRDRGGEDADGLAVGPGSGTGTVIRGCRTYNNSDDGLAVADFAAPVTIDATWSFGNGVNRWGLPATGSGHGFDLGSAAAHRVTRSAAWKNNGHGFTASGAAPHDLSADTAFRNAGDGFAFPSSPARLRDNLSMGNREQVVLADTGQEDGNTWNEQGWSTDVLRSLDPAGAEGPRNPDGSLPSTPYLTNTKDPAVGAPMTAS